MKSKLEIGWEDRFCGGLSNLDWSPKLFTCKIYVIATKILINHALEWDLDALSTQPTIEMCECFLLEFSNVFQKYVQVSHWSIGASQRLLVGPSELFGSYLLYFYSVIPSFAKKSATITFLGRAYTYSTGTISSLEATYSKPIFVRELLLLMPSSNGLLHQLFKPLRWALIILLSFHSNFPIQSPLLREFWVWRRLSFVAQ